MDTSIVSLGPIFIQPLSVDFSCQSARGDKKSALPILAAEINEVQTLFSVTTDTRSDAVMTEIQYYCPIMSFFFRDAHSTHLDEFMWYCGGVTAHWVPWAIHRHNTDLCVPASRATQSSCWNRESPLWLPPSHPYCLEPSPPRFRPSLVVSSANQEVWKKHWFMLPYEDKMQQLVNNSKLCLQPALVKRIASCLLCSLKQNVEIQKGLTTGYMCCASSTTNEKVIISAGQWLKLRKID